MKKGWLLVTGIIILLIVVVGALTYFVFLRDNRAIQDYTYEIPNFNTNEICDYYNEYEGKICVKATDSIYYYSDTMPLFH